MIFEHTNKINGITIKWTDGTANEGRNIVSVDTGNGPQPVNLSIPEAMQTLPDIADILYEISFIPVDYKPTLGANDVGKILGLSRSQISLLIKKHDLPGTYQNCTGWQIPWSTLSALRNRPAQGRPVEYLK